MNKYLSAMLSILFISMMRENILAATFEFDPSPKTLTACTNTIDLYIDSTGENTNSADIEIFFDSEAVTILDSNTAEPGIQIEEGSAFQDYWGNIVDTTNKSIFLAGGNYTDNTVSLNSRQLFAKINFTYLKEKGTSTTFTIRFDNIGNTVDSNIAQTSDGVDLLTSKIDGLFTSNITETCTQGGSHSPSGRIIKPTKATTIIEENIQDPVSAPSPTDQITNNQTRKAIQFSNPLNELISPIFKSTEYGINISNGWILSCLVIQFIVLFTLFLYRKHLHYHIHKRQEFFVAISKEINSKKLIQSIK